MSAAVINSIGLIADIIGALVLWKFGLPEGVSRGGVQYLVLEQSDVKEAAKAKRYDNFAKIGLSLLITGFVLQFLSDFVN